MESEKRGGVTGSLNLDVILEERECLEILLTW